MRLRDEEFGDCHLVVQSKHTTVDDTVSAGDISDWYKEAKIALAAWQPEKDHVVYVFFTNKQLSKPVRDVLDAHFFWPVRQCASLLRTSSEL